MQILVNAPIKCIGPQRAIFFETVSDNLNLVPETPISLQKTPLLDRSKLNGFVMHFSTQKATEDLRIQYDWHCISLKQDFMDTLSKFGRLPYSSPIEPL